MSQTVLVSEGAAEYVGAKITEKTGADISTDLVQVSLGTHEAPGAWVAPSQDTPQVDDSSRVVKLLVNSSTPIGVYYLWVKITDNPEVVPRRAQKVVVA